MKKIIILILCMLLAFTFAACGNDTETAPETPETDVTEEAETEDPADEGQVTEEPADSEEASESAFAFSTETFEGDAFTSEDVKDAKLIMLNFWEPWCGPCVAEMPDLEKVYEEQKDNGFIILGVYSTIDQPGDVAKVMKQTGVTYPILKYTSEFDIFQTGYVPTTVFMTGDGKILSPDPIIGGQSYDTWNTSVKGLLKGQEDD